MNIRLKLEHGKLMAYKSLFCRGGSKVAMGGFAKSGSLLTVIAQTRRHGFTIKGKGRHSILIGRVLEDRIKLDIRINEGSLAISQL